MRLTTKNSWELNNQIFHDLEKLRVRKHHDVIILACFSKYPDKCILKCVWLYTERASAPVFSWTPTVNIFFCLSIQLHPIQSNRPFLPLFQNDSWCKTNQIKRNLIFMKVNCEWNLFSYERFCCRVRFICTGWFNERFNFRLINSCTPFMPLLAAVILYTYHVLTTYKAINFVLVSGVFIRLYFSREILQRATVTSTRP